MTKAKTYSSATLWHQDNRYWSFEEENLISVWLALGDEIRKMDVYMSYQNHIVLRFILGDLMRLYF